MNKRILTLIVTVFTLVVITLPMIPTAQAIEEGTARYFGYGGRAVIEDAPFLWGENAPPIPDFDFFPLAETTLRFDFHHNIYSSFGRSDSLLVSILWPPEAPPNLPFPVFLPIALFTTTTNPDEIEFLKDAMVVLDPDNDIIQVTEDELKIKRHGKKITVSLTTQAVKLFYIIPQTIPAFSFTVKKTGTLMYEELSSPPSALSDYTYNRYNLYYEATGKIVFPGLAERLPLSDAQFNTLEFRTYAPPPSP